jgi:NAD+-dependent farnesol dehydrogenase
MRVLVTGGTGYLGRAVVHALVRNGHSPVVFARTASNSGLPGILINGDVRDIGALAKAAADCDAMCHMAAMVSLWQPRAADFDDINIGGLRNAIAAAESARISKLVYTSSFLARPPAGHAAAMSANDYQRTKVIADGVAIEAAKRGFPIVRLYPGVIYGPGQQTEGNLIGRLVRDHLAGKLPGLVGANRPWSYAWIDDVADAHVAAVERAVPGSSYVVGGINAPQVKVFEVLREITGRPLPRNIPFPLAAAAGWMSDARASWFGSPPLLTQGAVRIFREDWSLDSAAAVRDLGHQIRPLEQGVKELVASL